LSYNEDEKINGEKDALDSFILSLEEDQEEEKEKTVKKESNIKNYNKFDNRKEREKDKAKEIIKNKNLNEKEFHKLDKKEVDIKFNEKKKIIEDILKSIINRIVINDGIKIEIQENRVNVNGDNLSIVIGKKGKNLEAIEYIVNLILRRKKVIEGKIILDIKNYRKRQLKKLKEKAKKIAEKVIKENKKISLKPMTENERKIIYNLLSEIKKIKVFSKNEDKNKKIIVCPAVNKE